MEIHPRKDHHWDSVGWFNVDWLRLMGFHQDSLKGCNLISRHTKIALKLWPIVLGMLIILGMMRIEQAWFPVITDFHISKLEHKQGYVVLSGFMRKTRDCSFVGVSAELVNGSVRKGLPFTYSNPYSDASMHQLDAQGWGPWKIIIPANQTNAIVSLTATHRCHVWWQTQSHLGNLPTGLL